MGRVNLVLGEKVIYGELLFQQQLQEKKRNVQSLKKVRFPQTPASFKSREVISLKQQLQCHEAQHTHFSENNRLVNKETCDHEKRKTTEAQRSRALIQTRFSLD